jgi:hypothetical protein
MQNGVGPNKVDAVAPGISRDCDGRLKLEVSPEVREKCPRRPGMPIVVADCRDWDSRVAGRDDKKPRTPDNDRDSRPHNHSSNFARERPTPRPQVGAES